MNRHIWIIWVKWLTCEGKKWKRWIERLRWKNWRRCNIYCRNYMLRHLQNWRNRRRRDESRKHRRNKLNLMWRREISLSNS